MTDEYLQDLIIRFALNNPGINGSSLTEEDIKSILLKEYIPRPMYWNEVLEVLRHRDVMLYIISHCDNDINEEDILTINRMILLSTDEENLCLENDDLKKWAKELSYRLKINYEKERKVFVIIDEHLKFEQLRPFPDGNGRTARALIIWSCLQQKLTPIVIEKEQRNEYINALKNKDVQDLYRLAEKNQRKENEREKILNDENKKEHVLEKTM